MRNSPNIALPFDHIPKNHEFYSCQFEDRGGWFRSGEFSELSEAINESVRLREIFPERKTRIVEVNYKVFEQNV